MALITDPITQTNTEAPEINNGDRDFERPVAQESDRMTLIRPGGSSLSLYLKEIWTYRELLYFLALREVKVRYKQTVFGIAWALLPPIFSMIVFTLFFGKLAHMPSDGIPYPVFVYAALVPWTYFSNAVSGSANSLVSNSNLVNKVYFPRIIVPVSAVVAGWIDLIISTLMLLPLVFFYKIAWTWRLAMIPALIILLSFLATAFGAWMAALNVKYRDVRHALPFFIQAWLFITPVIYPSSLLPPEFRWLLLLNPLTGILESFRAATLGRPFNILSLSCSIALTLSLLCYSLYSFRSAEREFADKI